MKQLSQVLTDIRPIAEPIKPTKNISNMPQHGSTTGDGKTNIQSKAKASREVAVRETHSIPERLLSFTERTDIDWDGNCEFDAKGKVVAFKRQAISQNFSMLPIPKSDELISDAKQAGITLDSIMIKPTKDDLAVMIKKLSLHCGMQKRSPDEIVSLLGDYWEDLKDYPKFLIAQACQEYRKLAEGNNFMPSSGKLISFMDAKYRKMKFLRSRIDKILGIESDVSNRCENKSISITEVLNRITE